MDTSFYDVIVCGPSLGGLAAAALLGRRGLRVLHVGYEGEPRMLDVSGLEVPSLPFLLPAVETPALARLLRDLSCSQLARRRVAPLSRPLMWRAPEGVFSLLPDLAGQTTQASARFGEEGAAVMDAIQGMAAVSELVEPALASSTGLPPRGFWERREVARLETLLPKRSKEPLAALRPDHPLRGFVRALAAFTTQTGPADVGNVTGSRAFDLARRGYWAFEGGAPGFRALLTDKAGALPVDRRPHVVPIEIVQRRGRAAGVRLRPRDETIGCDAVIWAGPVPGLLGLFGDKALRRLRELPNVLRPVCHHFTQLLLVKREAPFAKPGVTLALQDTARAPLEDNALFFVVGEVGRQVDVIPIWVTCIVASAALESGAAYLTSLQARLRERLGQLWPEFDKHVVKVLPLALSPETQNTRLPALFSAEAPRALDILGLPFETGLPRLFLLGPENLPGLGVEGELAAAFSLAATLGEGHPQRDHLRGAFLPG